MNRTIRTTASVLVAAATAGGVAAGPAHAAGAQSATGELRSTKVYAKIDAHRAAGAPVTAATGHVRGAINMPDRLGGKDVIVVDGPVTCLDVRKDTVGLFYPFTSTTPTIMGKVMKGLYLTFSVKGDKPQMMSFVPSPRATASSCAPTPGLFGANQGAVHVTS